MAIKDNLTIISDNCWGIGVYKKDKIKYQTPFVNLFIHTPDYIKLVKNFKTYISCKLEFKSNDNYVIAKLNDVEISFSHSRNFEECLSTWNRRLDRINYDNILFKCGYIYEKNTEWYQNNLDNLIEEFHSIPNIPKISFTLKKYKYDNNFVIKPEHIDNAFILGQNYNDYVEDLNKFSGKI